MIVDTPFSRMQNATDEYLISDEHVLDLAKLGLEIRILQRNFSKFPDYDTVMTERKNKLEEKEGYEDTIRRLTAQQDNGSITSVDAVAFSNNHIRLSNEAIISINSYFEDTEKYVANGEVDSKLELAQCELDELVAFRSISTRNYPAIFHLTFESIIAPNLVGIIV